MKIINIMDVVYLLHIVIQLANQKMNQIIQMEEKQNILMAQVLSIKKEIVIIFIIMIQMLKVIKKKIYMIDGQLQ